MPAPYVLLAPGVIRIPTLGDFINSFAFLEADGSVTLVDCGIDRAPARIVAALAAIGRHPTDVQRIVLTHAHTDHAGGAADMVSRADVAGVAAHREDVAYLEQGVAAPVDSTSPMARMFDRLPAGGFAPVTVTQVLEDHDLLDVAGGLRVVHTPGHTPGHVSLLHARSGVLITGDCMFNPLGRTTWPFAFVCTPPAQNRVSAGLLADLEYDVAAFTHGPEIRDHARERIRGFLLRKGAVR
jgi:glyoxylase-like metal-dependent hydrolase (beta-lactamase superfamily II)